MEIEIKPSARAHLVTDAEIRAVIGFPALRIWLAARHQGAQPVLFVGPAEANQPWIEVIADVADAALLRYFTR